MSSPEYAELRGVSGTAVAPRAAIVDDPAIRRLLWCLQARSLEPGGLKQVAREILEQNPQRIGTTSMHKFGMKPGQVYKMEQVRAIRDELPEDHMGFPLRGETWDYLGGFGEASHDEGDAEEFKEAQRHPNSYPASKFMEACRHEPETLAAFITDLCVNPCLAFRKPGAGGKERSAYEQRLENEFPDQRLRVESAELYWFQDIIGALLDYQRRQEEAARADFVLTAIGRKVWEALNFALKARSMVAVEGREGRGKSEAVKAWCRIHRGDARFVDLDGATNKTMVFRAIAKSLGIASSYSRTATEMQARIQDVLQRSGLMLIFDEAHFLLNQSARIYTRPELIDWIHTSLRNRGVPVALITTPQFIIGIKRAELQVGWNWRQFRRRLRWIQLPEWNTDADLETVARKILPGISRAGILLAIGYAKMSLNKSPSRDISGLGDVATEARLLAEEAGRAKVTYEDVDQAIKHLVDSDSTFAAAMIKAEETLAGRRARKRFSTPPQAPLRPPSEPVSDGAGTDEEAEIFQRHRPGQVADSSRAMTPRARGELVAA